MTLVGQDWGSALIFDWANRNRDRVKGIVHMESILRPWTRADFPIIGRSESFLRLRSPEGEHMIIDDNYFVEVTIPGNTMRKLTDEEMSEYRRPYLKPGEDRRPTLTWPREIPYEGTPEDVCGIVSDYAAWLPGSAVPKLFVNAEPGFILTGKEREFART